MPGETIQARMWPKSAWPKADGVQSECRIEWHAGGAMPGETQRMAMPRIESTRPAAMNTMFIS